MFRARSRARPREPSLFRAIGQSLGGDSFLVRSKTDPKTVQALLRHSDMKTTLQLYAHSISEDRMAAQGQVLEAILQSASTAVN